MVRRSLALWVLLVACASGETPASSEAPASPAAPVQDQPVADDRSDSPWHWRSEALGDDASTPGYLLGLVGQDGVEHCPGGGYDRQWMGLHPTIGRVSVSGPDDAVLEPLMDQPVLALGEVAPAPERGARSDAATKREPCLPAQMRSDWRATPRGLLIERSPAPGVGHFRVDAVRPLHELQVRTEGDHVVVTLTNPVPVALADVELRMHYEGCFGKPGTTSETAVIGALGVGAQASARMPRLMRSEGAPGDEFRAYSVQVVGRGAGVVIDLDVPLGRVGAGVECPEE